MMEQQQTPLHHLVRVLTALLENGERMNALLDTLNKAVTDQTTATTALTAVVAAVVAQGQTPPDNLQPALDGVNANSKAIADAATALQALVTPPAAAPPSPAVQS